MQSNPSKVHKDKHDEHYTPVDILEMAKFALGSIDLDPATSLAAIERMRSDLRPAKFYTIDDPSPEVWTEQNVWCNPPFSKTRFFIDAAVRSCLENGTTTMFLMPANMSTKYIQKILIDLKNQNLLSPIMFHNGRVYFYDGVKKQVGKNPPGNTMIFMIGNMSNNTEVDDKVNRFMNRGSKLGHLFMEIP